jgi:hypothetical protein
LIKGLLRHALDDVAIQSRSVKVFERGWFGSLDGFGQKTDEVGRNGEGRTAGGEGLEGRSVVLPVGDLGDVLV